MKMLLNVSSLDKKSPLYEVNGGKKTRWRMGEKNYQSIIGDS